MGAKMNKRNKYIKMGYKEDMWFIVEKVIYMPMSPTQYEKSREYITRVFYNRDKAEKCLQRIFSISQAYSK